MAEKRIQMSSEIKKQLMSSENIPKSVKVKGREYYPQNCISSDGFKSVVWKGVDIYGAPVVIKVATYEDYKDRSYLQEVSKTVKLRDYHQFAFFHDADIIVIKTSRGDTIKCVCFIEEYVEGHTLKEYIKKNQITPFFILNYIREMCNILNILKDNNLRHDDLHLENVMIAKPKLGSLSKEATVKVIDMGSLKKYGDPLNKEHDDHERFVEHLIELYNAMLFNSKNQRRPLTLFERKFRSEILPLIKSMLDEDKQIALVDPSKILTQFEHVFNRSQYPIKEGKLKLEDPFDYISAEHIASDKLLVKLFADSCPWVKEVTSPNPILLTGPRGCGKSMLFRRLSLKAVLYTEDNIILDSNIAGFYISCSSNFRNRFGRITSETLSKRFQREIVHYFNLLLTHEIIHTLLLISKRSDRETLFGLGNFQEIEIHEFLVKKLHIKEERKLRMQGVSPLEHLLELVEFEMNFCYEQFLKRINLELTTPISFISDFTRFLTNNVRYFNDRAITFLLDDFSIHRISEQVQFIINPILWDRQPTHIFKLSAEKYGAERIFDFKNGKSSPTADITREFREVDCGRFYINLSDKDKLQDLMNFAKDLLDHRLELSGYKANSETIIGHSYYKEGTLSKSLRYDTKSQSHYHGLETISEICSGDVSALLEIYRRIFQEGKVEKDSNEQVEKNMQHKAIKSVSGNFFDLIKTYHPFGNEMYKIVGNFGTLCKKILTKGKEMKYNLTDGAVKIIPNETTRIEVDQIPNKNEEWTDEHMELMKELVRRSIFIEMEPGRGRHSSGPTWRWQLRRIYCPTFGTGLKKNTAIKWNTSDLKFFLIDPTEKCNSEFEKWKFNDNTELTADNIQTTLFDNYEK